VWDGAQLHPLATVTQGRETMTKRILLAVLLGVLIALTGAWADVDTMLCFKAEPFADTLKVWALSATGDDSTFALPAVIWEGVTAYMMSGATSTRLFEGTPDVVRLSLTMDNPSSFFGNNPSCRLRVVLQRATLNGSWDMLCTGGGAKDFPVSGAATLVACRQTDPTAIARAMVAPRLAGE
jgi:hypothetical protein